jgi:hypothetical protein
VATTNHRPENSSRRVSGELLYRSYRFENITCDKVHTSTNLIIEKINDNC